MAKQIKSMKIGLSVIKTVDFEIENNVKRICESCIKVKNQCDFIFFGETVVNGFNGLSWDFEKDYSEIALTKDNHQICKIINCAVQNEMNIGFGYYEKGSGNIFDSYMVISSEGEIISNYRRISTGWKIAGADSRYECGKDICNIRLNDVEAVVALCGDLWDNHTVDLFRKSKAKCIVWPVFIDYSVDNWQHSALHEYQKQMKKLKKDIYLINSINTGKSLSNGGAYYFDKNGRIVKEKIMCEEDILIFKMQ